MKNKKKNKTVIYTDAQLAALLKKSEIVLTSTKGNDQKGNSNNEKEKQ